MISEVSIVPNNGTPTEESIYTRYINAVKQPAREFLNTLYVCDRDIVYNNPNVDITEAWLINNSAYIYKVEDEDIVRFTLNEESCSGSVFEIGSVVSQKFTARLVYSDAYKENCTVPSEGYDNYFDDKCLIAFNRLALETEVNEDYETTVTVWGSVPIGVYYVYDEPKIGSLFVDITCYDKMIELDRKMTFINLQYSDVLEKIKTLFKVVFAGQHRNIDTYINSTTDNFYIPTEYTYRTLLSYLASFERGFFRFNRYGKLEIKIYFFRGIGDGKELDSSNIMKLDVLSDKRNLQVISGKFGGAQNNSTFNNGYPVKYVDLPLVEESIAYFSGMIYEPAYYLDELTDYVPVNLTTTGLPYIECGDLLNISTQKQVLNDDTYEYDSIDDEFYQCIAHKNNLTFSSGVAQTINSFDVDTENTEIASSGLGLTVPLNNGIFDMSFGIDEMDFTAQNRSGISLQMQNYQPQKDPSTMRRAYNSFATPKTNKPSKVFPPTNDFTDFQSQGSQYISGYSKLNQKINFSWLALKFYNESVTADSFDTDFYKLQDYLMVDVYEEYHTANRGYILLDNFIIEWGIAELNTVSVSADNEYYTNVHFYKEFAEEPTIILLPLTSGAYYVTGYSYTALAGQNEIKTGMRVYNCNKVFSKGAGKSIQWIAIGRSKDE